MYTYYFYLSTIWNNISTASPNRQTCWTCFERGSDGCCWTTLSFQALSSCLEASTSCWIAMWRWPFASQTTVLGLWRFTKQNLASLWSRTWPASGKQVFRTFSLPHRPYCPLGEQMFINRPSRLSWWYEQYWVFCNTGFKITFPYLFNVRNSNLYCTPRYKQVSKLCLKLLGFGTLIGKVWNVIWYCQRIINLNKK